MKRSATLLLTSVLQLVAASLIVMGAADPPTIALPPPVQNSDYRMHPSHMVELGRMLFYDRVLSGTYRVSCATCHNPDRASSNGFARAGVEQVEGDDLAINGLPIYDQLKPSSK
ncbi:MAG: cytochrome c peroxidase, partial [Rhizobiaceae bacterium]